MTTALDMIPAIGARVSVRFESLQIEATVKNVKNSYGQPRLLIVPVSGSGEQWVELGRVTVPATVHPGEKHEHSAERPPVDRQGPHNWCAECGGWFKPLNRRPDREGLNRPALPTEPGEDWRDVRAARDFGRD